MRVRTIIIAAQEEILRSPPMSAHERRDLYLSIEELLRDVSESPHHRRCSQWFAGAAAEVHSAAQEEHEECRQLAADTKAGL